MSSSKQDLKTHSAADLAKEDSEVSPALRASMINSDRGSRDKQAQEIHLATFLKSLRNFSAVNREDKGEVEALKHR